MDIYGTLVLLLTTVVVSALLTAALFGVMFGIHKYAADKIPDTNYGNFDFNNITRATLSEFLARLSAIIFPPTILLHILIYILFPFPGTHPFRQHAGLLTFILFVLETGAIATGLALILKLDRNRLIILTSVIAVLYLLVFWLILYDKLYS